MIQEQKVSAKHPTQERIYAPLRAAVVLLEAVLAASPADKASQQLLAEAKIALTRLEVLVPPMKEVLADFLEGGGPIYSRFDRAQNDAWREGAHDPTITDSACKEMLSRIEELFQATAPTARIAEVAYQHVEAETALLRRALDEAQADGWSRGDYCSELRDDLVERFVHIVSTAALGITSNQDTP